MTLDPDMKHSLRIDEYCLLVLVSTINRDYVSKILQALTLNQNPSPLVVKYVRTTKPHLTEPDDINLYSLSLADLNFLDAWRYQRTYSESSSTRTRLLHKLLEWCLSRECG